jgi:hypothetical protein
MDSNFNKNLEKAVCHMPYGIYGVSSSKKVYYVYIAYSYYYHIVKYYFNSKSTAQLLDTDTSYVAT